MLEFYFLVAAGAPSPSLHLLSNHYNETRTDYYRQLDAASKVPPGDVSRFLRYALQGLIDQLRAQLTEIKQLQWDVSWRDYVYEAFRGTHTDASRRRRQLVLHLSLQRNPVRRRDLTDISPQVAGDYASAGPRTLSRDINELLRMGLLVKTDEGFVANMDRLRAFVPVQGTGAT